jgi:hypothetical protein
LVRVLFRDDRLRRLVMRPGGLRGAFGKDVAETLVDVLADLAAAESLSQAQLVRLLRPHVLRGGRWAIDLGLKERLLVRMSADRKAVTVLEVSLEHYRDSSR